MPQTRAAAAFPGLDLPASPEGGAAAGHAPMPPEPMPPEPMPPGMAGPKLGELEEFDPTVVESDGLRRLLDMRYPDRVPAKASGRFREAVRGAANELARLGQRLADQPDAPLLILLSVATTLRLMALPIILWTLMLMSFGGRGSAPPDAGPAGPGAFGSSTSGSNTSGNSTVAPATVQPAIPAE